MGSYGLSVGLWRLLIKLVRAVGVVSLRQRTRNTSRPL